MTETTTAPPSSYSGFLGFRGAGKNNSGAAGGGHNRHASSRSRHAASRCNTQEHQDEEEAMSIVSVATSKNFYCNATQTNESKTGKNKQSSSAISVLSDISASTVAANNNNNEQEEDDDDFKGTHEFVLKCKNDDMVFVSSLQGRVIKQRCRHFRLLLATGNGGHVIVGGSEEDTTQDNRILQKETWTAGTARHVIELLTQGTTYIAMQAQKQQFQLLAQACDEIDVKLCLGSLINYHDLIDHSKTRRFFQLKSEKNFQFKIKAVITSWQWLQLLDMGILLMDANAKVLMVTVAPPKNVDDKTVSSSPSPVNQQRLAKCDSLFSEFAVYSKHGSKINALLTILELLRRNCKNESGKSNKKQAIQAEQFKITYKTRVGSIQQDDLNMLWRLTSASYTLATIEERRYLVEIPSNSTLQGARSSFHTAETLPTSHTSDTEGGEHSETSITSDEDEGSPIPTVKRLAIAPSITITPSPKFQYRTIAGTSCMILSHLFDPINVASDDDEKMLPACISVTNPTPDTLGRFLNAAGAAGAASDKDKTTTTTTVGWDMRSPTFTVFYVSCDSHSAKQVVSHLSNYENSAVVDDNCKEKRDFLLQQYVGSGAGM